MSVEAAVIDPSKLHLKKELTQIRKAARLLKDPGTTSSWKSPIGSTKVNNHGIIPSSSDPFSQFDSKDKEKKVFLYNWRRQKSGSERSRKIGGEIENENENGNGSSSSFDGDSLANDSKSETYLSDIYASALLKFKNGSFTPSIKRKIKKPKPNRSSCCYSSSSSRHCKEKVRMQDLLSRYGLPGLSSGGDDVVSLIDQSVDTEYCYYSEDLMGGGGGSLLAALKSNGWSPSPGKFLRRKDDGSVSYSTPVLSASSYNRFVVRNASVGESWDGTVESFNDADDEVDDQLGRQGCGIPCYWSRRSTPKSRNGSSCSPSLSDTLRRKGIVFGGGYAGYQRRHQRLSLGSNKRRSGSGSGSGSGSKTEVQSLIPLLTNTAHCEGGSDDELSTNFGELELEALNRLDGRRWSVSCRSQESSDLVGRRDDGSPENLSHKYRPMFFDELIGQNIVVQSLVNALSRSRIAPVYLFQGPRGVGKSSTARIFSAALNCIATEETKPCGFCRECTDFISGKSRYLAEVDGSNEKGIEKIKSFVKNISAVHSPTISQYRVFVIDECHLLSSKTWLSFLRLLEKPMAQVVFVLITSDIDNMPRAILSRCQKHLFSKISNGDIVNRLRKISIDEKFDVEPNALELIASNANGSLRDAETMLDQLSLFGKRITKSMVNELIGVVSDEKLLDLLELAMSSNTTATVIKARELMDSGIDPVVLMSQLVTLVVDIIAGKYRGKSLNERELDRLKHALTHLSQAEKHLRVSSERSTWFAATLLQLGSVHSSDQTQSTSSRRQSSKTTEEDSISMPREVISYKQISDTQISSYNSQYTNGESATVSHNECSSETTALKCTDSNILVDIWLQCIDKCHSKTLRQLLHSYGKLISISEMKGGVVAEIAFADSNVKARAEGFLSSITNSFETVLQRNVEIKTILRQDEKKSGDTAESHRLQPSDSIPENADMSTSKDSKSDIDLRRIESIIHEQRLETAWLQAMDKGTPGSTSLKPERNQVLPQDGIDSPAEYEPTTDLDAVSKTWQDELAHEMNTLKVNDGTVTVLKKDPVVKGIDHRPISPSLLHRNSLVSDFPDDNLEYEPGSGNGARACGCSAIFCWRKKKPKRRTKVKQVTPKCRRGNGQLSWLPENKPQMMEKGKK